MSSRVQVALAAVNLLLGILFWVLECTTLSLRGTWPDLALPFVVLVSGGLSSRERSRPWWATVCRIPSIVGGWATVLAFEVLLLFPPFWVTWMFRPGEVENESEAQRLESPDGGKVAVVVYRGVGAYAGGDGYAMVRLRRTWLPLIEQDLHVEYRISKGRFDHGPFVLWRDDGQLMVPDRGRVLDASWPRAERPRFLLPIEYAFYMAAQ